MGQISTGNVTEHVPTAPSHCKALHGKRRVRMNPASVKPGTYQSRVDKYVGKPNLASGNVRRVMT